MLQPKIIFRDSVRPRPLRKVGARLATGFAIASLAFALPCCSPPSEQQEQSGVQEIAAKSSDQNAGEGITTTGAEGNKDLAFDDIPTEAVISIDELETLLESESVQVIDVRSRSDYEYAFIEGSKNIPAGRQIEIRMGEIPQGETIALISLSDERLAETRQTLIDAGYDPDLVKVVEGGIEEWSALGHHVASKSSRKC